MNQTRRQIPRESRAALATTTSLLRKFWSRVGGRHARNCDERSDRSSVMMLPDSKALKIVTTMTDREIDCIARDFATIPFGHAAKFDHGRIFGLGDHFFTSTKICRRESSKTERTVSGVKRALTPWRMAVENCLLNRCSAALR